MNEPPPPPAINGDNNNDPSTANNNNNNDESTSDPQQQQQQQQQERWTVGPILIDVPVWTDASQIRSIRSYNFSETIGKAPIGKRPVPGEEILYLMPEFNQNTPEFRCQHLCSYFHKVCRSAGCEIMMKGYERKYKKAVFECKRGRVYRERKNRNSNNSPCRRVGRPLHKDEVCPFNFSVYWSMEKSRWYFKKEGPGNTTHIGHCRKNPDDIPIRVPKQMGGNNNNNKSAGQKRPLKQGLNGERKKQAIVFGTGTSVEASVVPTEITPEDIPQALQAAGSVTAFLQPVWDGICQSVTSGEQAAFAWNEMQKIRNALVMAQHRPPNAPVPPAAASPQPPLVLPLAQAEPATSEGGAAKEEDI